MARPPSSRKASSRSRGKRASKPTARKRGTGKGAHQGAAKAAHKAPFTPSRAARQVPPAAPFAALRLYRERLLRLTRIPAFVYLLLSVLLLAVLVPSVNWIYQVLRKPSELFFPVSDDWYKTPAETWRTYGPLFIEHATAIMTPELLAALAQKEASGNPIARTYWRWAASRNLFEIYRPASSAVGMYQFTDATFDEARRYCIHDHRVVADGPWYDFQSCWFNRLYARVIPSHAVELTAANLDRQVRAILARQRITNASLAQQQQLAIIVHLCGAGAAAAYASRGLHLEPGQKCGDHDPRQYIERVEGLMRNFAALRH